MSGCIRPPDARFDNLRLVLATAERFADGEASATDACRSYHAELARLGIRPRRPLDDDLELTATSAAYA